jgi:hypothetical protein
MTDRWDIFLCHLCSNHDKIEWVRQGLASSGYSIWFDGFLPATSLNEEISMRIRNSSISILCYSKELHNALNDMTHQILRMEYDLITSERSFFVILLDTADEFPHEALPPLLRNRMYVRLSDLPRDTYGVNVIGGIADRLLSE